MAFSRTGCQSSVGTAASRRVGREVPHDLKPVLEAHLLDLDVHTQEVDLLTKRDDLMAGVVERKTQQPPETRDHLVRGVGIGVHQLSHGVQGVEQKVRL